VRLGRSRDSALGQPGSMAVVDPHANGRIAVIFCARCASSPRTGPGRPNGMDSDMRLHVTNGQVKLSDIVPLARTISGRIADIVIDKHHKDGIEIACRKGCGHCCQSHLVPLAVPEAFRLNEYIHSRHRDLRDAMLRSCLLAAQDILVQEPPESFTPPISEPVDSRSFLAHAPTWYVSLGVCCPFLSNNVCTIYENRPLACRDYFVRGGSNACINADPTTGPLKMPMPMVEVLGQLAGELEGSDIILIPLLS
jgi:Fe-S-cluster containining protein